VHQHSSSSVVIAMLLGAWTFIGIAAESLSFSVMAAINRFSNAQREW
jgi:hypothetical protein